MVSIKNIQCYCDAVGAALKPQRIILFGSHNYGTPNADSDVDVFVVMPKSNRMGRLASLKIRQKVTAGFPVDIVVRDMAFVAKRLRESDTFLEEITAKGRVMYESGDA